MKFNFLKVAIASLLLGACSPNLLEEDQSGVVITDNTIAQNGSISGTVSQASSAQENPTEQPLVSLYKSGTRESAIATVQPNQTGAFKFDQLTLDTFDIVVDYKKGDKRLGATQRSIILTPEDTAKVNINITINIFVTQVFNIQLEDTKSFESISTEDTYSEAEIENDQISLTSSLSDTTYFELKYTENNESKTVQLIIYYSDSKWVTKELNNDPSEIDLSNVIAYWDFKNIKNNEVIDLSSNQNNGTLNGALSDESGTLFSGEGTSFANFSSIDHLINPNSFKIQTELLLESYPTYQEGTIAGYAKWDNGSTQGWEFRISRAGYPEFIIGEKGTSNWTSTMSSQKLELQNWYTLSAQFDGKNLSISIDGVEVAKLAHISPLNLTNQKINIGKRSIGTPDNTLNTKIKYVQISSVSNSTDIGVEADTKALKITLNDENSYDTYVDYGPGKKTKNFGQNTITSIGSYDDNSRLRELLKIDFNDSLKGKSIQSVTLTLKVSSWISKHSDESIPIDIHKMLVSWEEGSAFSTGYEGLVNSAEINGATYYEKAYGQPWNQEYVGLDDIDASSKVYSSSKLTKGVDSEITFNITELAKDWIENPESNNGLLMRLPTEFETGTKLTYPIFHSSEATVNENRPEITIIFND